MKKKVLTLFVTLAMLLSLVPFAAIAEDDGVFPAEPNESAAAELPEGEFSLLGSEIDPSEFAAEIEGGDQYETLSEAFASAVSGDTITLLDNVALAAPIQVTNRVTLNLNGKTVTPAATYGTDADGIRDYIFGVRYGGDLTVDGPGTITAGEKEVVAIKLTLKGEVRANEQTFAKLTVNGGTIIGCYYAVSGNGGRPGTVVTINDGVIRGTAENDSVGIFNPQKGTLTINGGLIEGAMGVYAKSGEVTATVNAGTIRGTGIKGEYQPSNNGFENTGDAFVLDNCGYPGGAPQAAIEGGTFESEHGFSVASYAKAGYEPVTGFITGGIFSDDVSEHCADGYVCWDNGGNFSVEKPQKVVVITEEEAKESTDIDVTFGEEEATTVAEAVNEVKEAAAKVIYQVTVNASVSKFVSNVSAVIGEGAALEIKPMALAMDTEAEEVKVTSLTFDVTPKDSEGNEVHTMGTSVSFRLPVPADWDDTVTVIHDDSAHCFGKAYSVLGDETSGKYVELSSKSFSAWTLKEGGVPDAGDALAQVGTTFYDNLQEAVDAALAANSPLKLLRDVSDEDTLVFDEETFTEEAVPIEIPEGEELQVYLSGHLWEAEYNGDIVALDAEDAGTISVVVKKDDEALPTSGITKLYGGEEVTVDFVIDSDYAAASLHIVFPEALLVKTEPSGDEWTKAGENEYYYNNVLGGSANDVLGSFVLEVDTEASAAKNVNVVTVTEAVSLGDIGATASTIPAVCTVENNVKVDLVTKRFDVQTSYNKDYDGEAFDFAAQLVINEYGKTPAVPVDGVTVTYAETEDGAYTATAPTCVNVGVYTVYCQVEKEGYETYTGALTVTVEQVDMEEAWYAAIVAQNSTYDGTEKELMTGELSSEAPATLKVQYSTDDGATWADAVPTATDDGQYVVYFRVVDTDGNYRTATGMTATAIIEVATHTVLSNDTYAFGYKMILVFTQGSERWTFTDAGGNTTALYLLKNFGYTLGENGALVTETNQTAAAGTYKVYAWVVPDTVTVTEGDNLKPCAYNTRCTALSLATSVKDGHTAAYDLNADKYVNIKDASAAYAIAQGDTSVYFTTEMKLIANVLRADINGNGTVDIHDYTGIVKDYAPEFVGA